MANPGIGIAGFASQPGNSGVEFTHMANVYEEKGDFVWVHGRHTFQMGVDFNTNNASGPIIDARSPSEIRFPSLYPLPALVSLSRMLGL